MSENKTKIPRPYRAWKISDYPVSRQYDEVTRGNGHLYPRCEFPHGLWYGI